ncbi:MAG: type II secretion system protein GspL [Porticoccaceae bacterium]|nr:type II secretion system protein GspL [Porticoccaceae bacterium]
MTLSVDHLYHLDQHLLGGGETSRAAALWVPSQRVTVHVIDAPTAPQRKWLELIPWILEDRILQPVDEMHFVLGASSLVAGKKQLAVTVISKQDMREWLRIADNAGVTATAMVPDYLALPFESGRISMAWREGQFLVRTATDSGFSAPADLAWLMVRRLMTRGDLAPRLSISLPDSSLIPEDLREAADINAAEIDWQFAHMPLSANLLTGEFEQQSSDVSSSSWLSSAALLVLALVLGFGYLQLSNIHLEEGIAELEAQAGTGFSNVFLGQRAKPEDIRSSGEQLMADMFKQRESLQAPIMRALAGLDSAMSNCGCELESLDATDSVVTLALKNVARGKAQKTDVQGFKVDRKVADGVTTLTLREVAQR